MSGRTRPAQPNPAGTATARPRVQEQADAGIQHGEALDGIEDQSALLALLWHPSDVAVRPIVSSRRAEHAPLPPLPHRFSDLVRFILCSQGKHNPIQSMTQTTCLSTASGAASCMLFRPGACLYRPTADRAHWLGLPAGEGKSPASISDRTCPHCVRPQSREMDCMPCRSLFCATVRLSVGRQRLQTP